MEKYNITKILFASSTDAKIGFIQMNEKLNEMRSS